MIIRIKSRSHSQKEKKSYQVLDFSLTTNLLPGSIKEFSGPTTSNAICRQIESDARLNGMELPYDTIRSIVGLFFRHIVYHMRKGNFIRIKELGDFGMSKKTKEIFTKRDHINTVNKYYRKRLVNRRKVQIYILKCRWKAFNNMREEKGLEPWKFKEWIIVNKIKIKRKVRNDFLVTKVK